MQSKRFSLNGEDFDKIVRNAGLFAAPALLIFLTTLQTGGTWNEALVALKVWVLNAIVDVLRKLVSGGK